MEVDREAIEAQFRAFILEDERRKRQMVSPKMEQARHFRGSILGFRGGRSAGAKTTGMVSLNVQESHREEHRVIGLREVQASLEESLYQAVQEAVDYLQYPGWKFPRSQGYCESPVGSRWVFRGMSNLRAARSTKGLQGFDRFIADEASDFSSPSIDMLLPTVMKVRGSKFFFAYNPMTESDPIFEKVWKPFSGDPMALLIDMEPGRIDNPWFNEGSQMLSDKMKAEDPDLWEHIWGGKPLKQGQRSVLSRVAIREAMERTIDPVGGIELGIDCARFGDDKTVIYKRHGMKIVDSKELTWSDTQESARIAWDMVKRDRTVKIKVDEGGLGAGVVDKLRDMGANVVPINFGGKPKDENKYTSAADEMWFEFGEILPEISIPDDPKLMAELSGRLYDYTRKDQRKIEPKSEFKKRLGRSPDRGDAIILCYYESNSGPIAMSDEIRRALAARSQ